MRNVGDLYVVVRTTMKDHQKPQTTADVQHRVRFAHSAHDSVEAFKLGRVIDNKPKGHRAQ